MTSLLSVKHMLYIGTAGGVIIELDTTHWAVLHLLWGYTDPVQCLVPLHQGTATTRRRRLSHSRPHSFSASMIIVNSTTSSMPSSTSSSSLETSHSTSLSSSGERLNIDRNMVLSFGTGYRGIVGDDTNHPPHFLLSSTPGVCGKCHASRINCSCENSRRIAKPDPFVGYVLYWYNAGEDATPTSDITTATNNIDILENTLESTITPGPHD